MNILEEKILNRSVILSLINEDKIIEANNCLNQYCKEIEKLKINKDLYDSQQKELLDIKKNFYESLIEKFKKDYENGSWDKAIICIQTALNYDKEALKDKDIIKKYLCCLAKSNQLVPFEIILKEYKTLIKNNVEEYKFIANMYHELKIPEKSTQYMEEFINSKDKDEIMADDYNWAGIYQNQLYFENNSNLAPAFKAVEYFEKAHEKYPENTNYMHNVTIVTMYTNQLDKQDYYWTKLLRTGKLTKSQLFDYSLHCLKRGDLPECYDYYPNRFYLEDEKYRIKLPKLRQLEWDGFTDLKDSTLMVYMEQGYGDTLLMSGYMHKLIKLAKKILYVIPDHLYSLMQYSFPEITVYPVSSTDLKLLDFDYYIPQMQIPGALHLDKTNVSVGGGYLKADPEKVKYYKEKYFNNDSFKIGICHCSKHDAIIAKMRYIPLETFKLLENLENTKIYSLNKDIDDEEFDIFKKNRPINIAKTFNNFSDTAAAVENCDIIVSSDGSIMNLAGALGKKTFTLFNWVSEYRWFDLSGDDVVWFTTVKPFVNEKMNDWNPTMERVVEEIKKLQKNN